MSEGSKNGIFVFDGFKLDVGKLMLYRDGAEVSIPPKVAKTLAVLVESAGTIISKEEIIDSVWNDSIVEESNLNQYLYLLRKVLGSMPDGRPYIETLRRRGYRFNGQVARLADENPTRRSAVSRQPEPAMFFGGVEREGNVLRVVDWQTPEEPTEDVRPDADPVVRGAVMTVRRRRAYLPRLAVAVTALLLITVAAVFLWPRLMPAASEAEPLKELSVVRLTNGQMPASATIAPDGNAFAYTEYDGEVSRFYLQQTGQASRIELARSAQKVYGSKTFSPDGQWIYYTGSDKKTRLASVYRIPAMGGAAVKIVDDIQGVLSFSPDGKEIVFSRRNFRTNDSSLVIADKDGRTQRVLVERKGPRILLSSPAWSPDGKVVVFGETTASVPAKETLHVANVATGQVTAFSDEVWDNIMRVVWSPDGAGILMIGTRENDAYSTRRDQVYFVSYPEGVSRRVTTDGNRHDPDSLGVTKKGEVLAVSANRSAQVWAMGPNGRADSAIQLTRGTADGRAGLGPLPDGRFGYVARTADEIVIMMSDADGSNSKQLATGLQYLEELRADPLGRFFVFSALKDGVSHLFRIDVDGGAVKQLTFGETREIDSTISPDGKYLTYDSTSISDGVETFALKRIPTDGGEAVTVRPKGCFIPTYSPDGSLVSCISSDTAEIMIVSAADGSEVERHPLPVYAQWNFGIGWTPDGSGLMYIVTEMGTSNIRIQPRDGSKVRSLTNFTSGIIHRYAFAPDGSKLYVARGFPIQDAVLISNYR